MLDDHWEQVGEVDTANEPDAQRFWQGMWKVKAASREKSAKFYIMVDPATAWYSAIDPEARTRLGRGWSVTGAAPFWLAFHWAIPEARTYYAIRPSTFATLMRRPPESHPGLKVSRTAVAIQVTRGEERFFDVVQ